MASGEKLCSQDTRSILTGTDQLDKLNKLDKYVESVFELKNKIDILNNQMELKLTKLNQKKLKPDSKQKIISETILNIYKIINETHKKEPAQKFVNIKFPDKIISENNKEIINEIIEYYTKLNFSVNKIITQNNNKNKTNQIYGLAIYYMD